jgi:hypothetical protein
VTDQIDLALELDIVASDRFREYVAELRRVWPPRPEYEQGLSRPDTRGPY